MYSTCLWVRELLAVPQYGLPADEKPLRVLEETVPEVAIIPSPAPRSHWTAER